MSDPEKSANKSTRRVVKWLNPRFQRRYSAYLIIVVTLICAALIGIFWYFSEQVMKSLIATGIASELTVRAVIMRHIDQLILTLWIVIVIFMGLILLAATVISNRIVGPIFAITRSLEAIAEGDFKKARIRLRKKDEFQEVGEMVNRVIDRLESSR